MADENQEAMRGGPGQESDEGSKKKEQETNSAGQGGGNGRVKVQVGDREVEVDESVALLLESQQRGFEEYQRQTAQYVRQIEQRLPQAGDDKVKEKDDGKGAAAPNFYDDPDGWMQHHMGQYEQRVRGYIDESLTKSSAKDRQREFWDEFYSDNDDLKGADALVNHVFQSNVDRLADMPVGKAKQEIARMARAERDKLLKPYLGAGGAGSGSEQEGGSRQIVTRAGGGQGRAEPRGDDERPQTLGGVLKARRAKRFQRRGAQE